MRSDTPRIVVVEDAAIVVDDPSIDIVSIASFDDAHAAQVMRALDRGKHVFVEKPLCLTVEEFRAMEGRLTDNPKLRLSSNLILRASPRFIDLRQRIGEGGFGRLFNIEADYLYGRLEKLTAGWRSHISRLFCHARRRNSHHRSDLVADAGTVSPK